MFCNYGQAGGARRGQFVWKVFGLALTSHAGIEVDLLVPGGHVSGHHHFGLRHCGFGRQVPPRVGPEMVTTQEDTLQREPSPFGGTVQLVAERLRRQTGIATLVVHLVASRLDQYGHAVGGRLAHGCFYDDRVGRAHRGYGGRWGTRSRASSG